VRGKAGIPVEFGAKISVSLVGGYTFIDRMSWDNFNESGELIEQIESYRQRFGYYPESVHADRIYRSRDNLQYCARHGIRLSLPRLGRPKRV
jgi:IS5 family transposase